MHKIYDHSGDFLEISDHMNGKVYITAVRLGMDPVTLPIGPIDPREVIVALALEADLDVTLRETDEAPEPEPEPSEGYVHTTPATAEEPRLWAGADEPIIDRLVGRVAALEDRPAEASDHPLGSIEHFRQLAEEEREALIRANSDVSRFEDAGLGVGTGRQDRVETLFLLRERLSRKTVPAGGAFGDVARALFGAKEAGGTTPPKTDDLLKIARFILDGHRDLPGVDK